MNVINQMNSGGKHGKNSQEEARHITEANGQLFFEFFKYTDTKNMHRITFDICKKIIVKTIIVEHFQ